MKKLLIMASIILFGATTQAQITINGQSTPATIQQNSVVTVSLTYTSTVTVGEWQIQLFPVNQDGSINFGGPTTQIYIGNNYTGSNPPISGSSLPIATSPSTLTFNSYCDGAIVPVGNYKWFVKLKESTSTPEEQAVYGNNDINVTVTSPSLSVSDFKKLSDAVFVNSATKTLKISDKIGDVKSVAIYNAAGAKVKTIQDVTAQSTHDLSMLVSGLYVLISSDNQTVKFVL